MKIIFCPVPISFQVLNFVECYSGASANVRNKAGKNIPSK